MYKSCEFTYLWTYYSSSVYMVEQWSEETACMNVETQISK